MYGGSGWGGEGGGLSCCFFFLELREKEGGKKGREGGRMDD